MRALGHSMTTAATPALPLATAGGIVVSSPLVARWGYKAIPMTPLAGLATASFLGLHTGAQDDPALEAPLSEKIFSERLNRRRPRPCRFR
jgi:hypothetical protein